MRKFKTLSTGAALIGGATALVLAASGPAMAASWTGADLTAIAGAPAAAGCPFGYTTNLTGQGPVARVDYKTTTGHIEELFVAGGQRWAAADLTAIAGAPAAAGCPFGFETDLTGPDPVARVDYRTAAGHIEELSVQAGQRWAAADLTAIAGAPLAAGNPDGYTTNLTGQGPVARVDYKTTSGHIEELFVAGGLRWAAADLTAIAGAPAAAGNPFGFETDLTGQGPVARVDYKTTSGHIEELSVQAGQTWGAADLTAIAGAPAAVGNPDGYTTNLTGQGPVARVDYRTSTGHIEELFVAGGQRWAAADLTAIAGAPAAAGDPFGFETDLTGQGPVARVDYKTTTGHIEELSVQAGQTWGAADLTAIAGAPAAAGNPDGFETDLTGQGPVARVDYKTTSGHIEELSVS